ncbi:MAG: hypothetical protein ACE5I5_04570, partial [Candidatus Heimdallarchaeota archaeon]
ATIGLGLYAIASTLFLIVVLREFLSTTDTLAAVFGIGLLPLIFMMCIGFIVGVWAVVNRKIAKGDYEPTSFYSLEIGATGLIISSLAFYAIVDSGMHPLYLVFGILCLLGGIFYLLPHRKLRAATLTTTPAPPPTTSPKMKAELTLGPTSSRFCASCGQGVSVNNTYCGHCGAKLPL